MAKHTYTVVSERGAEFAGGGAEVGHTVELDLSADNKRAVIAAGWVEPIEEQDTSDAPDAKKGGKK